MRSSSSRVDAESTEASRKTAALLTQPASGAAACAASAARSVTASSPRVAHHARSRARAVEPLQRGRVELDRHDRVAVGQQPLDDRAADPAAPAGDDVRARQRGSVELLVGRDGEELGELVGQRDLLEQRPRLLRAALALEPLVVADLRADALELLALQPADEVGA